METGLIRLHKPKKKQCRTYIRNSMTGLLQTPLRQVSSQIVIDRNQHFTIYLSGKSPENEEVIIGISDLYKWNRSFMRAAKDVLAAKHLTKEETFQARDDPLFNNIWIRGKIFEATAAPNFRIKRVLNVFNDRSRLQLFFDKKPICQHDLKHNWKWD